MNRSMRLRTLFRRGAMVTILVLCMATGGAAQSTPPAEGQTIGLPAPQTDGNPFLQILMKRASSRAFRPDPLPDRLLSNLLWAAAGINRPESGRRTAPTANNRQEIEVYAATAEGLYIYEAKRHTLKLILAKDIRELTGRQAFVKSVPLNLVYVADQARSGGASEGDRTLYAAAATGFISQNVYLYCAAEGLATFVRAMIDRPALAEAMKLRPDQKIILAQSVGYPGK